MDCELKAVDGNVSAVVAVVVVAAAAAVVVPVPAAAAVLALFAAAVSYLSHRMVSRQEDQRRS